MTSDELVDIARGDRIFIVGAPASGKTTLCNRIRAMGGPPVIHTDNYMRYGFLGCVDAILNDLKVRDRFTLEGVQSARVLRRIMKYDNAPGTVIYLNPSDEEILSRYKQREGDKKEYPIGMKRSIETVMNEVIAMMKISNRFFNIQ